MYDFLKKKILKLWMIFGGIQKKGSFTQNFAITFSGSAFTIVMQLLLTPIIARIYGPEGYGVFGIFNAIVFNVGLVASLMYEQALVLPKTDDEFKSLLQLSIGLSIISSFIVLLITIFWGDGILMFIGLGQMEEWKYLIAPAILILCFNQIIGIWVSRIKAFKKSVPINSGANLGIRLFNIGYGLATKGATHGLILGEVVGKFIGLIIRIYVILRHYLHFIFVLQPWNKIKSIAIVYKNYPRYILPSSWINLLSNQIPLFILGKYFGINAVGYYSLANSLLGMPLTLLGYSISPVFMQKAAEVQVNEPVRLKEITEKVYTRMFNLGFLPFAFLAVFGEILFSFVFSEEWREAGIFASYLGVFYVFRLVATPLNSLYKVLGKEKISFYFSLAALVISIASMAIGVFHQSVQLSILLFSGGNLLVYLVDNIIVLKMIGAKYLTLTITSILKMFLSFLFFLLIKLFLFD